MNNLVVSEERFNKDPEKYFTMALVEPVEVLNSTGGLVIMSLDEYEKLKNAQCLLGDREQNKETWGISISKATIRTFI